MLPLNRPLVSPEQLAARLGEPGLVVIDCRHQLLAPEAGRRSYLEGHIPGARHAHMDEDLAKLPSATEGRHPLPSPAAFVETLRGLGLSNRSWVVAYDDGNAAMASRLWWMLRWLGHEQVSVLDGGLKAWRSANLPVEEGVHPSERGGFALGSVHTDWVVEAAQLQRLLREDRVVLIDARAPDRFHGREEPIDAVAGHIPGAINLPYERLLSEEEKFLSPQLLRQRFEEVAVVGQLPVEIVAMCGSGVTACHLLLGMDAAGLGMARLYAGSWSEWIRDRTRPVATDLVN